MSIQVHDRKILWGLSGNRCAFPGCNQELLEDKTDGKIVVGEECHIIARENKGPRGNITISEDEKDKYENLILLCPTHHTVIDGDPEKYTPEKLKEMRSNHEDRIRRALADKSTFDALYYEAIVRFIDTTMDFEHWDIWTSYLLSNDRPMCTEETYSRICTVINYILGRVWYKRYLELEDAIQDFHLVLNDLITVFCKNAECEKGVYVTEKFYKIKPYDYRIADKLLVEYKDHLRLIRSLVYEMTKAANRICDLTRNDIDPEYRLTQGKLLLSDQCPEYKNGERYIGLEALKKREGL